MMNQAPLPADFDWVTARAKCSAAEMIKVLRIAAQANARTRNAMADVKDFTNRFQVKDRVQSAFTVWDSGSGKARRAVDVDLLPHGIQIDTDIDGVATSAIALVVLNNFGQCKLKMNDTVELDPWQVLKNALEPLFFGA